MITFEHLVIRLGVDSKSYLKGLKSAEKRLRKFADTASGIGMKMSLFVSAPALAGAAAVTKMAMDVVESENLVRESFGGMQNAATAWSEKLRDELGLNDYELRKNAGTLKVMMESMGVTESSAYDMSTALTQLAGDMASFYNVAESDAFEKLRSGIAGESEPLKQLGILVNDTTVKAVAYKNGIAKVGQALTETQKVQGRYLAIMQATTKAQGDLARTVESPANQLRILQNQLKLAAIEAGKALLPALEALLPALRSGAATLGDFARALNESSTATKALVLGMGTLWIASGPLIKAGSMVVAASASVVGVYRRRVEAAAKVAAAEQKLYRADLQRD